MNDIIRAPARLIILTALAAEAETLLGHKRNNKQQNIFIPGPYFTKNNETAIIQCGIGRDALLRVASPHLKNSSIIGNIGVSGGLAPDLKPGTVILADRILSNDNHHAVYQEVYTPSAQLLAFLEALLKKNNVPYRRGPLLCTPQPISTPDNKEAAYLKTEALAVDMESVGAAEVARQAGLPFFCIRVVCDPAERRLQQALFVGVDSRGNNRPMRLINPLIRRPWLLIDLFIMARDFSRALTGMRQVWNVVHKPLADLAGSISAARTPDGNQ